MQGSKGRHARDKVNQPAGGRKSKSLTESLSWQSSAGNRAVAELLASKVLQRQTKTAGKKPGPKRAAKAKAKPAAKKDEQATETGSGDMQVKLDGLGPLVVYNVGFGDAGSSAHGVGRSQSKKKEEQESEEVELLVDLHTDLRTAATSGKQFKHVEIKQGPVTYILEEVYVAAFDLGYSSSPEETPKVNITLNAARASAQYPEGGGTKK